MSSLSEFMQLCSASTGVIALFIALGAGFAFLWKQGKDTREQMKVAIKELKNDFDEQKRHVDARFDEQKRYVDARFDEQKKNFDARIEEQKRYVEARFDEQKRSADARSEEQKRYSDTRFESIDARFEEQKKSFAIYADKTDARLEKIESSIAGLNTRMAVVEAKLVDMNTNVMHLVWQNQSFSASQESRERKTG